MKYSIGQGLADSGFGFFEKLHEPIFLVHRMGRIVKQNEAARKLLRVAHLTAGELEAFMSSRLRTLLATGSYGIHRMKTGNNKLQLIATTFRDSDFILVEVKR